MRSLFFLLFSVISSLLKISAQQLSAPTFVVNYQAARILEHNADLGALLDRNVSGVFLQYNKPTEKDSWGRYYNFPDYGISFLYQDLNNPILGRNLALYGHYNFYFLNRKLQLGLGTGVAYNTNPYDAQTNFRNVAYGSQLMSTTFLTLNFHQSQLFKNVGAQVGLFMTHFSNGRLKTPNTSTNMLGVQVGLHLNTNHDQSHRVLNKPAQILSRNVTFTISVLGGVNENNVIGIGRKPFVNFQAFAAKRLSYKSTVMAGSEIFFSQGVAQYIEYRSIAFPDDDIEGDEDSKRIGVFVGYELHISKTSIFTQLGFYAYYPVDFESRFYNRLGIKRTLSDRWSATAAVKAHAAKAEALEFGIGYTF